MFSAILILLLMPFTDLSRSRGIQFRPLSKITFFTFTVNFIILMLLGAKHVEYPFIELGQISTVIYFAYFLIIVPKISLLENSLIEYVTRKRKIQYLVRYTNSENSLNSSLLSFIERKKKAKYIKVIIKFLIPLLITSFIR
jgi:ubiquinol-cytochrome c reductase cytochrome b subunit